MNQQIMMTSKDELPALLKTHGLDLEQWTFEGLDNLLSYVTNTRDRYRVIERDCWQTYRNAEERITKALMLSERIEAQCEAVSAAMAAGDADAVVRAKNALTRAERERAKIGDLNTLKAEVRRLRKASYDAEDRADLFEDPDAEIEPWEEDEEV